MAAAGQQQAPFFALAGGLDQVTQPITIPNGRCIAANNYESLSLGYGRIQGYERFDGRPSPTAVGQPYLDDDDKAGARAARDAARAAIQPVPGTGPVRGVWYFGGIWYAWRDTADGAHGGMYRATASGWVQVSTAFAPGGRYFFITHNFYGNTAQRAMYGVNGVGRAFMFDGTTVTFINTGLSDALDKPIRIAEHKEKLILGFLGGSVQGSQVGDPTQWSGSLGAFEIAVGDEIADFIANNVDSLGILTTSKVMVLTGSDPDPTTGDLTLSTLTQEAGAIPFTAQRIGSAIYLDNRGIRSITATQAYGNFKTGTMTSQIDPYLATLRASGALPTASVIVRSKDHYRLFYSNGLGFSLYLGRKTPEPMPFDLGISVRTICSIEDTSGSERIMFGSDSGYVYEMDVGTSFDGAVIEAVVQIPFVHEGSPRQLKRWHKAIIELVSAPETVIGLVQTFDYGSDEQPGAALQKFTVAGGGGLYNLSFWNDFQWSAPIEGAAESWLDGVGRNMSITIACVADDQDVHVLQGMTLMFTFRGQVR